MDFQNELIDRIFSSISYYNRMRSPEATARLIEFDEISGLFKVEFSGPFCLSCGLRDWLEDLVFVLREKCVEVEFRDYEERDEFKIVGVFKVKGARSHGC